MPSHCALGRLRKRGEGEGGKGRLSRSQEKSFDPGKTTSPKPAYIPNLLPPPPVEKGRICLTAIFYAWSVVVAVQYTVGTAVESPFCNIHANFLGSAPCLDHRRAYISVSWENMRLSNIPLNRTFYCQFLPSMCIAGGRIGIDFSEAQLGRPLKLKRGRATAPTVHRRCEGRRRPNQISRKNYIF